MNDLDKLLSDELRRRVEENLGRDPSSVALDKRLPDAALVASQVKYLQRAERKLPSYYAARCVISPLAFEQSSGERAAAQRDWSGDLCIDLTCGLGVDSFHFSKRFARVVAVERDAEQAAVARENFRRLGAHNIEVVEDGAENFIARFAADGARADLIYADPDRRGRAGAKLVLMEDCSPDIAALLPTLRAVSDRVAVKLSPLFDVGEVFRLFGRASRATVVSSDGECKEVLAEIAPGIAEPLIRVVATGVGMAEFRAEDPLVQAAAEFRPDTYRWLAVPDAALRKSRTAVRYLSPLVDYIDSDNGYGFSSERPIAPLARIFEIGEPEPFDPKALKRSLRSRGIASMDIMKRDFPLPSAEIARRIGVCEGGTHAMAFTRAGGRLWQMSVAADNTISSISTQPSSEICV